ncbi:hypothetical protein MHPYR_60228 [uncultured Mycobacterium sp.]|uniref:Uncharacterized protein n=1 Tax=uncultured Mycobacterium sp. TaxID=171292 RepID=A0A1Y5PMX4_9MYCO|nr:hypothetical protein MHPYR_60228 [uncultured Mycobacterium sp.]
MTVNGVDTSVVEAVDRLNRDIAEAEERVAQLRAMRDSIQPFIEQYMGVSTKTPIIAGVFVTDPDDDHQESSSITDEAFGVFRDYPDEVFDLDNVVKVLRSRGSDSGPVQIRNAINYMVRIGRVHRGPRRGTYTLLPHSSTATDPEPKLDEPFDYRSEREEDLP